MVDMIQPKVKKTFSLQKRLLVSTLISSIVSSFLALILVVGIIGYDMHEFFDDILEENGKLLIQGQQQPNVQLHLDEFNEELDFVYQIIHLDQQQLYISDHAPQQQLVLSAKNDEFYNVRQNGQWWRVYVLNFDHDHQQLQVAQRWKQRYTHFLPAIAHFLWIMAVLWLLLILGSWIAIRHSLKSLQQITTQIAEKNVQNLSPVQPIQMMQEMQPMVNSINQLLARLQQALIAEQQFTADAAHELRTPLSAIQMKLQLLQRQYAQQLQPLQHDISQLQHDVKRTTSIVENLLLLARLDPEQGDALPKNTVDIHVLLDELVKSIQLQVEQAQIIFQLDWSVIDSASKLINKELIFTALRNVLDNAIRYSGSGCTVLFRVSMQNTQFKFEILDNGVGVSEQDQLRLNDRFFRVLGTGQQGSGLGLSIVKRIIELHHGQMYFTDGLEQRGFGVVIIL